MWVHYLNVGLLSIVTRAVLKRGSITQVLFTCGLSEKPSSHLRRLSWSIKSEKVLIPWRTFTGEEFYLETTFLETHLFVALPEFCKYIIIKATNCHCQLFHFTIVAMEHIYFHLQALFK